MPLFQSNSCVNVVVYKYIYLYCSVKVASISHSTVEQELFHLATQASSFLDRLYPAGKLNEVYIFINMYAYVYVIHNLTFVNIILQGLKTSTF